MPTATVHATCLSSTGIVPVQVEAMVRPGIPRFRIIGLPDRQVLEARDRVRAALRHTPWPLGTNQVTVSLHPANLVKRGTLLDLAIATAILQAGGHLPATEYCYVGELALDGVVRFDNAALAAVLSTSMPCVCPQVPLVFAPTVAGRRLAHVSHLRELASLQMKNQYSIPSTYPFAKGTVCGYPGPIAC